MDFYLKQMTKRYRTSCPARTLWLISSFAGALFTFCYLLPPFGYYHIRQGPPKQCQIQPGNKIIVLYWTKYFGVNDFGFGIGKKSFAQCDPSCSDDCLTTTDRNLLNKSDAVIFHARDLKENDLPPPEWRRPHQHFIFFLYESPAHTDLDLLGRPVFKNYFNRTMTYRRDSDVVDLHPYGRIKCIDPSPSCLDFPRLNDTTNQENSADPFQIDLKLKNRTVAWFVSNCETHSQRELLARNLSHFIPVDIYGKCGDGLHHCQNRASCNLMMKRNYRFYLSFENSLCPDYVTEKLYRPLAHDTVPVVYGGSDYSLFLPAGSYINARDFDSPQSLANYLKKLMTDDEHYLRFFRWKKKFVVDPLPVDGMCQLCRLLSNTKMEAKSYPDISAWWAGNVTNQTCFQPPTFLV